MANQLTKMKEHNKYMQEEIDRVSQHLKEKQKQLFQTHQTVDSYNKTINSQNIQLSGLKSKEVQIEAWKEQVKKLNGEKENLSKTIHSLKVESQRRNLVRLQEENLQKS